MQINQRGHRFRADTPLKTIYFSLFQLSGHTAQTSFFSAGTDIGQSIASTPKTSVTILSTSWISSGAKLRKVGSKEFLDGLVVTYQVNKVKIYFYINYGNQRWVFIIDQLTNQLATLQPIKMNQINIYIYIYIFIHINCKKKT